MRVHNPGPGEILDRLGILARKRIENDTEEFQNEQIELFQLFFSEWDKGKLNTSQIEFVIKVDSLTSINAAIWQLEDEIRAARCKAPHFDITGVAFKVQKLNDERALHIRDINLMFGIDRREKKTDA